jgi:hypothetical protein
MTPTRSTVHSSAQHSWLRRFAVRRPLTAFLVLGMSLGYTWRSSGVSRTTARSLAVGWRTHCTLRPMSLSAQRPCWLFFRPRCS